MKIVILDDSATIRMILESFLEDIGVRDDEMFLFENGHDAVEFIKENGADIIFTDINMPNMDGYEFASSVFKMQPNLKNSLFAISGDENRESYQKMKKSGVHRFLRKPINAEHFNHFVEPIVLKSRMMKR
ncbi:MAG: response regulator [Sulfurimonas sp.]|nr:response regulator [Sulfurimonas sp.]